ncbi:hypothetical protein LCGC14_0884850 [marine sediment metagenome]|uniref:Uncharacterized protein n=1 Tax=marine sediment metagenome TaxID=412755 RepID=A0A0F9S7W6_9ZZZZ
MKLIKNKKAVIDQLAPLIIGLVTISIILVIGFLIFSETKTMVEDRIDSKTSIREAVVWSNGTFVALNNSGAGVFALSCSALFNGSQDTTVEFGIGNVTCTPGGGINVTKNDEDDDLQVFNTTLYVTYSYSLKDSAYNATTDVQNATQDIPTWLPIIVITIIGALLIGLIGLFRTG